MTRGLSPQDVLARVTLVTGKEEFLAERTVTAVRDAVHRHDPEAELSESEATGLTLAALGEMSAPSLFSSTRCVVVRGLENLPDESVDGLLAYAASPAEDVAVVLVHGGGQKGSGVLAKLRKLGPVTEVKSEELRASEYPGFVTGEVRALGGTIEPDAAAALVQAVGQDLRSLSAAADQLANDFPGETLTEASPPPQRQGRRLRRSRVRTGLGSAALAQAGHREHQPLEGVRRVAGGTLDVGVGAGDGPDRPGDARLGPVP